MTVQFLTSFFEPAYFGRLLFLYYNAKTEGFYRGVLKAAAIFPFQRKMAAASLKQKYV
jgi:hypothetical protein